MNAIRSALTGRRVRGAVTAVALAAGSLGAWAAGGDPAVPGEILVKLRSTGALGPLLTRYGLTLKSQFGARPIYRLQVIDPAVAARDLAKVMVRNPAVLVAEPNFAHQSPEARKNNFWAIGTAAAYTAQWAPGAIGLGRAQALATGEGMRVAVLDTGVDPSHPALAGRLLAGRDFVDGDFTPWETPGLSVGHGTHVAGLVALVAPGVAIMPLRVMDGDGRSNAWVLAEALLHAVDPDGNPATDDGAHVINMSLGSLSRTALFDTIAQLVTCAPLGLAAAPLDFTDPGYNGDKARCAGSMGAVIAVAAGNNGNASQREFPAAESAYGKFSVAASTTGRRLAAFSNFGSWVDLAAPGDLITSSVPAQGYATWSGTSMATPLVAGTAALVRQLNPTMSARDVVRRVMRTTSAMCGTRLRQLDATAALTNVVPPDAPCP